MSINTNDQCMLNIWQQICCSNLEGLEINTDTTGWIRLETNSSVLWSFTVNARFEQFKLRMQPLPKTGWDDWMDLCCTKELLEIFIDAVARGTKARMAALRDTRRKAISRSAGPIHQFLTMNLEACLWLVVKLGRHYGAATDVTFKWMGKDHLLIWRTQRAEFRYRKDPVKINILENSPT